MLSAVCLHFPPCWPVEHGPRRLRTRPRLAAVSRPEVGDQQVHCKAQAIPEAECAPKTCDLDPLAADEQVGVTTFLYGFDTRPGLKFSHASESPLKDPGVPTRPLMRRPISVSSGESLKDAFELGLLIRSERRTSSSRCSNSPSRTNQPRNNALNSRSSSPSIPSARSSSRNRWMAGRTSSGTVAGSRSRTLRHRARAKELGHGIAKPDSGVHRRRLRPNRRDRRPPLRPSRAVRRFRPDGQHSPDPAIPMWPESPPQLRICEARLDAIGLP